MNGEAGLELAGFRILRPLGEGASSVVYLAEQQEPVRRTVAVKVLRAAMIDERSKRRFALECDAMSRMEHRNITKLLGTGETSAGRPYMVMEYVDGEPLTAYCERHRLGIRARAALMHQICLGLHHAHQKGLMHRDIKAANLLVELVDGEHVAKLIDFGVAKVVEPDGAAAGLTRAGEFVGTLDYVSPEQARLGGAVLDSRSDIYSLGVVLYELLSGELPFGRGAGAESGVLEYLRAVRDVDPSPPSERLRRPTGAATATSTTLRTAGGVRRLRGDLDWVVMRCLEKDPERRYPAASELAADLQRFLDDEPVTARAPSAVYRMHKFVRRNGRGVLVVTVVSAALLVSLWGTIHLYREERHDEVLRNRNLDTVRMAEAEARRLRLDAEENEAQLRQAAEATARNLAAADARLAEYRCVKDVPLTSDLLAAADSALWPVHPDTVPALDAWLRQARGLCDRSAEHQAVVQAIGARAAAGVSGSEASAEAVLENDRFLHRLVQELNRDVEEVRTRWLPAIEARRRQSAELRARSIEDHRADWGRALAAIAADLRFRGMPSMPAQIGLVPLGPDPESRLQEFALLHTGSVPERGADGRLVREPEHAMVLVLLPPATFWMGSQADDESGPNYDPRSESGERPMHEVTLDAFFMSKFETTQGQWLRWMDVNLSSVPAGSVGPDGPVTLDHPVEEVSWDEAMRAGSRLRIMVPTEAQWEYAARGGATTAWPMGADPECLVGACNLTEDVSRDGFSGHAPVGTFPANGFGLHDMVGNLYEWCRDLYTLYGQVQPRPGDGLRPGEGEYRTYRSSGFVYGVPGSRSAWRAGGGASDLSEFCGVRYVKMIER